MDEPKILALGAAARDLAVWGIGGAIGHPLDPDRWAEERQYLRNDATEALAAFRRRREEVLSLLEGLSPDQWRRAGVPWRDTTTTTSLSSRERSRVEPSPPSLKSC
jgi:hypothetical protein